MAVTITRTPWIDDDGTGTTGTVINNAVKTELYNQIDQGFAALGTGAPGDFAVTGKLTVPAGVSSGRGTVVANSGTATTLFTVPATFALYLITAALAGSGTPVFTAYGVLIVEGPTARLIADVTANLQITLSGLTVQGTQVSGAPGTISWAHLRVSP